MSRSVTDMLAAQDAPTVRPPPMPETCPACSGTGSSYRAIPDAPSLERGDVARPCWSCRGTGEVQR